MYSYYLQNHKLVYVECDVLFPRNEVVVPLLSLTPDSLKLIADEVMLG